jgi:addiction module HigA family antidote
MTRDLNITADKINNIINGKQSIDSDLAIRLSKYFGTSTEFWLTLQSDLDLRKVKDHKN